MNENEVKKDVESGISLRDILNVIRQNILIITVICVITFVSSALYTRFIQKESYSVQTSLVVGAKNPEAGETGGTTMTANAKMQFAIYMAKTFAKVIQSPHIKTLVRDSAHAEKPFAIQVHIENDTFYVQLLVTSSDRQEVVAVANELMKIGIQEAERIFEDASFLPIDDSVSDANVAATKFTARNLAIGLALGVIISAAYILMKMMLETTFSKIEEVEEMLDLRVLTNIPLVDMDSYKTQS